MSYALRKRLVKVMDVVLALICLFFIAFPIFWLVLTSFKPEQYVYSNAVIFPPTLDNFRAILAGDPLDFKPYFLNSMIISLATVLIAIPLATMAAYVLSRYVFKGSLALLLWMLTTQFLPPVVVVIPFFTLFRRIGLIDTHLGLIIINLSLTIPYAVWMLKGFADALPGEVEEAAMVDGCNEFQVLRHVTFPLLMPGVITTAEGAEFNYNLARFGAGRGGLLEYTGSAAHNPFLTRALLIASIEAVEEEYGVTPSQAYFDWKAANPDLLPEWAK